MVFKLSTLLVLLSALNHYYVSGAIVSLLVPNVIAEGTLTGQYLGTDGQGRTSWSLGAAVPTGGQFTNIQLPGFTLVEGPTDVHQSYSLDLDVGVGTVTAVDAEACTFAKPTNGGAVVATCTQSGRNVGVVGGTATSSNLNTAYTTTATLMAVQVPDSGPGAIPTGAATASTPSGTGGSSSSGSSPNSGSSPDPSSSKNGASKGGVSWGIAGPACLFLLIASLM